jgi:hypothetical protein
MHLNNEDKTFQLKRLVALRKERNSNQGMELMDKGAAKGEVPTSSPTVGSIIMGGGGDKSPTNSSRKKKKVPVFITAKDWTYETRPEIKRRYAWNIYYTCLCFSHVIGLISLSLSLSLSISPSYVTATYHIYFL